MEKNLEHLVTLCLKWWEVHQYDTTSTGDGDEVNVYDSPPDFVILASKILMENSPN